MSSVVPSVEDRFLFGAVAGGGVLEPQREVGALGLRLGGAAGGGHVDALKIRLVGRHVDDEIVLPFCSALDWRRFSVRITSDQVPNLPSILRAIPHERVVAMQQRLAGVKRRYFLFPFNTAMSLMRVRVREALRGG